MTVPAVVIGGYLGAGKTTLVNHLLRNAEGRRIAVLVNDFGEVSIDADLIEGADGDVLALAGGCVCCSFGSDLLGALARMVAREPAPDVLLVETSGVGVPSAVARTVRLAPGVSVEGVVVVADAASLPGRAQDRYVGDVVRQQLADADLLVLNRTDAVSPEGLAAVRAWLSDLAGGRPVLEAVRGAVPPEAVLGWRAVPAEGAEGEGRGPRAAGLGRIAPSPTLAATLAPAADRFASGLEQFEGPVSLAALRARLAADTGLVRAKGIVQGEDGRWHVVQAVGQRVEMSPWPGAPASSGDGPAGRLAWIRLRGDGA